MKKHWSVIPILLLLLVGCNSNEEVAVTTNHDYENPHLLVDVEWLMENLDNDNLRIVDMRDNGFEEGHIPGAIHIAGPSALTDEDHEVASYLLGPDDFADLMAEKGIGTEHEVVIYDSGNSLFAARLFYALELYGHEDVKILNGGLASWKDNAGSLSTEPVQQERAEFESRMDEDLICDIEYIQEKMDDPNTVIFDARSGEEFLGEDRRAQQAGHIPGAVNIEWSNFVYDYEDEVPYFRTAPEIRSILASVGVTQDKEVIPLCHSNVRGSHVYFTLRLMGYDSVKPYEGSWSEYGNVDGVPVN